MALSTHNPSIVTIHTHFEFISLLISIQYFFQVLDNYLFICDVFLSISDDNFSGLIKKSVQDCLSSMLLFTTQMLIENWKQVNHYFTPYVFYNNFKLSYSGFNLRVLRFPLPIKLTATI